MKFLFIVNSYDYDTLLNRLGIAKLWIILLYENFSTWNTSHNKKTNDLIFFSKGRNEWLFNSLCIMVEWWYSYLSHRFIDSFPCILKWKIKTSFVRQARANKTCINYNLFFCLINRRNLFIIRCYTWFFSMAKNRL